ncbi:MAG TPA: MEDS domain-containing protein [Thermomicrobiales bacterium]|nr:MEDS domain-containing protein [Thermomicrobiales bacterium]
MTASEQATPSPIPFAGGMLDPYRHVCAFVDSRNEEHRILDPFVTDGLERGEKLVYFSDADDRANLVRHFRRLGLDMSNLLGQGRFEFRTWAETYLRNGRFDYRKIEVSRRSEATAFALRHGMVAADADDA